MTTSGMNGTDVLLLANTGTDETPVWTAVGCQRDMSIEETNEEIDMSSKDGRAKRVIAGRWSASISLDALYVPDDTAYLALWNASKDGDKIKVQIEESGASTWQADAMIANMSKEFPDQGAATIAIDLTIDGEWVAIGT